MGEGGFNPSLSSPHDPTIKKELFSYEWVKANDNVAIWAREKEDVTEEEYAEFYSNLAKDGTTSGERETRGWALLARCKNFQGGRLPPFASPSSANLARGHSSQRTTSTSRLRARWSSRA